MSDTENTAGTQSAEGRKRAEASNFLPIVRGRLPLIFVHAVRFVPTVNQMGNKDLAVKLGTSVGKVFDIKKGRNFDYVNADWKPTAEDIAAAEAHIAAIGSQNAKGLTAIGDKTMLQSLLDEYKARGTATAEEAAAQSAARGGTRTKKEGGAAAKAPVGEVQAQASSGATADQLLG